MGTEQQYCLKWNNHRSTILSVFDTLLEEESLVDVTLSADGQFLRAHRVILSACSPYFRSLFRSSFLLDKAPVIVLKDVDFDNLKSLVEFMYKGEVNVPQHMLPTFLRTAGSLQIRGLAEGGSKHYEGQMGVDAPSSSFPAFPSPNNHSTPRGGGSGTGSGGATFKERKSTNSTANNVSGGGILAARLAQLSSENTSPFLDFGTDSLLSRPPSHQGHHQPPPKKSRKSEKPTHKDESKKENKLKIPPSSPSSNKSISQSNIPKILSSNNNSYDIEEGALKIDEDIDNGKDHMGEDSIADKDEDDIVDLDGSNGIDSEEEEEPSMPGPDGHDSPATLPRALINPWTGEEMSLNYDAGESPNHRGGGDTGLVGWQSAAAAAAASLLGEFSEHSVPSSLPQAAAAAAAAAAASAHSRGPLTSSYTSSVIYGVSRVDPASYHRGRRSTKVSPSKKVKPNGNVRLKRLTNTDDVYTIEKTPDGDKFRCKACSRRFNLKCTLLRHVRHQHQGRYRPHPCPECGQVFKRTDHLKVHLKKIHQVVTLPRIINRGISSPPSTPPPSSTPGLSQALLGGGEGIGMASPASTASSTNGPSNPEDA
ncbi:protein tramtrack, beta isoform-like isoform X1 [Tigriopus californicus]|uniref:protein tramtrack, beta isoform-like isoform X1 n=1 Tax=Tigriopus californicus TaxID=6832 RepID=UPI0027D9F01C|nr:protein tramtrack, beta isoform-like isoform X1 [Tigriopus californicus]XP_059090071.1 protein tramtrack, beta isoform-like isoform X1 [Tigriopus californicus]XP_059090072.1 protein tramtrack, beta isoform-like isoform X1 [Tigriopus californicus]